MIDWAFISSLEGHRLSGYVPDAEGSDSGVTIADGVDLGQMGPTAYAALPADLQRLLRPFVGLRRGDAVEALRWHPLVICELQAQQLNEAVRGPLVRNLRLHYDEASPGLVFDALHDACQTVMASVTFQYSAPWVRCPRFWRACIDGQWMAVVAELEHFGDAYPTRRHAEADYFKTKLGL